MESKTTDLFSGVNDDMRTAFLRWYRFSNDVLSNSLRLGQPLMDAYFKGLSDALPKMAVMARKGCQIPETDCPPYCVCTLEWDARQDSKTSGTINVMNTGKQEVNFKLAADNFRSGSNDSGIRPHLSPDTFTLAPGATQTVAVAIVIGKGFDAGDLYETEGKVRGRYEQCVRLRLTVRSNPKPHCEVEHGEIPRHIKAHHWYDHFQCEELCFEPVRTPAGTAIPAASEVTAGTTVQTANKTKPEQ